MAHNNLFFVLFRLERGGLSGSIMLKSTYKEVPFITVCSVWNIVGFAEVNFIFLILVQNQGLHVLIETASMLVLRNIENFCSEHM